MRRHGATLLVLGVFAGIGLSAGILHARDAAYPLPPVPDRLLYLRSGKVADRLMLSFDAVAADVYWIRTIQHYGRDRKSGRTSGKFELLQPLLDLTTTLDPQFSIVYRFGAIFLALQPPDGPGRPDLAIALLEKGEAANPDRWQLPHDIGFIHYWYTGDYASAAVAFERAASRPGAPSWIAPLAATTKIQGGNREDARRMLQELRASQEAYIRQAAERALLQVDALDAVDLLDRAVSAFAGARQRYPSGWSDLVQAGLIPGIPVDAARVPFVYDPVTHAVSLSPESPLSPLPPVLRRR